MPTKFKITRIAEAAPEDQNLSDDRFKEFEAIVKKDQSAINWLKAITLLEKSSETINKTRLLSAVIASMNEERISSGRDLIGGQLEFKQLDNITHILGKPIKLPVLSFAKARDYINFMKKIGYSTPPKAYQYH